MTKNVLRVLSGETVWPPPVWMLRQAGRYLPEYREIRAGCRDFIDLATTPAKAAEVTLQPVRRFGMDAAILFSDILMVPWALGQGLTFEAGEGPQLPPIRDAAGVAALNLGKVEAAIAPILETVRLVAQGVGAATLIGFAGSPFTVACYMVEGHGSKEFAATRTMAHAEPALFAALMAKVEAATIIYLNAQIDAGAEAVMLFDSWAGMLSPNQFRQWVIAPTARIVRAIRQAHPGIKVIGFPRLSGMMVGEYAQKTGVDAVHMDTAMDPVMAADAAGIAMQGNLDPLAVLAGGDGLKVEVAGILAAMRGRRHIFNLGHGILPPTPIAHVEAMLAQVRAR